MSRIGKQPIPIPDKVRVSVEGQKVTVEGPLGRLERSLSAGITCQNDAAANKLLLSRAGDTQDFRRLHSLERNLVRNMVLGVSQGYRKILEIIGIGYNVKLEGNLLLIEVGYANIIKLEVPQGIKVEIQQPTNPGRFTISGADKQQVGQFAARARGVMPPEPYHGKGIKYSDEVIRRKAGKAFVGAGG